ncbi:hypothetical protein Q8F55_008880 [Vanrija albida]|uniref:BTB domain-containing protein n=1 Tax=Vanrija albida TaxID=181172 RepID=A0ABR3PS22_9TREE
MASDRTTGSTPAPAPAPSASSSSEVVAASEPDAAGTTSAAPPAPAASAPAPSSPTPAATKSKRARQSLPPLLIAPTGEHLSPRQHGGGRKGRRSLPPAPSPLNPRARRHSVPATPHPRTANTIPLHSDFDSFGDVVLVCSDGEQMVGFKVHSVALRTVCDAFATLGTAAYQPPKDQVFLDEPAEDVHAFLRFLTAEPDKLTLNLVQCIAINRLLKQFSAKLYLRTPLAGYVYLNAANLVAGLGTQPPKAQLVRMLGFAADIRAAELWHWFIFNLRFVWPQDIIHPNHLSDDDIRTMGISAYGVLTFLALGWSRLDECNVGRDPTGLFFVMRTATYGQQIFTDTNL